MISYNAKLKLYKNYTKCYLQQKNNKKTSIEFDNYSEIRREGYSIALLLRRDSIFFKFFTSSLALSLRRALGEHFKLLVKRFSNFWKWLMFVEPLRPNQKLAISKVGLKNARGKSFRTFRSMKWLACFKKSIALENLVEICSLQSKALFHLKYFVFWTIYSQLKSLFPFSNA